MNREIKNGAVLSYLMIFFNIVSGLLYTPWMIQTIGKADYGIYTLAMTFLAYFIMDFGLGSAVSRFVSKYHVEGEQQKVNAILGMIYKIYIGISCVILIILLVLFCCIDNIFVALSGDEIAKFKIVYVIAGAYSIISFPFTPLNGVLTSYEKFTAMKLCDLLNKVLTVALMIFALLTGYRLYALVIVNAIVGLLIILIKLIIINKETSVKVEWKFWDSILLKNIISFSVWMTVMGIASRLIITIAPSILGIFAGAEAIAEFSVASTVESYVYMFANALNGLFLPKVTALNEETRGDEKILDLMVRVGRIQLIVVGVVIIGFIGIGKSFITIWMGKSYVSSYYTVLCLIVPGLVSLTQEIAYTKMIVDNKLKYRALLFLAVSILSSLIGCILSPTLGAVGCGVGIFVALVLGHVIGMNILYHKQLNLDVKRFFEQCHLKMAIPMGITLIFGVLLNYIYPANNYLELAGEAFIIVLVYFVLLWKLALNDSEKGMFRAVLKRVKKKE